MGDRCSAIRNFKWEKDRFSQSQTGLLRDDRYISPERLQEIQFSKNKLCKKTREINLLKIISTAQNRTLFKKNPKI